MNDQIKDMMYAIANGEAMKAETLFNDIVAAKASSALEVKRQEVAATMFAPRSEE